MMAVPARAAALGHLLDRWAGAEFGWESLLWHEGSGLNRNGGEGHQAGECRDRNAHFGLHRREGGRCCNTTIDTTSTYRRETRVISRGTESLFDSLLEGNGFELPVCGRGEAGCRFFWAAAASRRDANIVSGNATNRGVETSVRDSFNLDFASVVAPECCWSSDAVAHAYTTTAAQPSTASREPP